MFEGMFKSMKKTAYDLLVQDGAVNETEDTICTLFEVKALANWKGVYDVEKCEYTNQVGQLVECTYNGNTDELYVDHYKLFDEKIAKIPEETIEKAYETGRPIATDILKEAVFEYAKQHLDVTDDVKFTLDDVYVVWNYGEIGAMISTSLPDGMYYDVSVCNEEEGATFDCVLIEAYKKANHKVYTDYTKSKEEN